MSPAIEIDDVQIARRGRTILDVPHLKVDRGETLTVIGPNGAGKSTLLRLLGLLERPQKGTVTIAGRQVKFTGSLLPYRRRIALVLQQAILRNASVFENVATGLRFRRLPRIDIALSVDTWMERLSISHLRSQNARTISGGEAQRVSLARALALQPELLLLDEPFSALDEPSKDSIMEDLRRILDETQVSTVFVTHQKSEAISFSDRLAVMFNGEIVQVGNTDTVLNAPATEEVASLTGVENILAGRVAHCEEGLATVEIRSGKVTAVGDFRVNDEVTLGIRPEDVAVEISQGPASRTSARNRLYGTVSKLIPLGYQYRLVLDCGFPLVALVTKTSLSEMGLKANSSIVASFKASAVHVLRHRPSVELRPF